MCAAGWERAWEALDSHPRPWSAHHSPAPTPSSLPCAPRAGPRAGRSDGTRARAAAAAQSGGRCLSQQQPPQQQPCSIVVGDQAEFQEIGGTNREQSAGADSCASRRQPHCCFPLTSDCAAQPGTARPAHAGFACGKLSTKVCANPPALQAGSFILTPDGLLPGPVTVTGQDNRQPSLDACALSCFNTSKCTGVLRSGRAAAAAAAAGMGQAPAGRHRNAVCREGGSVVLPPCTTVWLGLERGSVAVHPAPLLPPCRVAVFNWCPASATEPCAMDAAGGEPLPPGKCWAGRGRAWQGMACCAAPPCCAISALWHAPTAQSCKLRNQVTVAEGNSIILLEHGPGVDTIGGEASLARPLGAYRPMPVPARPPTRCALSMRPFVLAACIPAWSRFEEPCMPLVPCVAATRAPAPARLCRRALHCDGPLAPRLDGSAWPGVRLAALVHGVGFRHCDARRAHRCALPS